MHILFHVYPTARNAPTLGRNAAEYAGIGAQRLHADAAAAPLAGTAIAANIDRDGDRNRDRDRNSQIPAI